MAEKMKNIILCADGTGNSGGVGKDTNVWRLFNAVDVSNNLQIEQIAFHDDGVGTNKNIVMKALGMAFGLGLSKNIRELYKNAVMQYQPNANLYLFGFSRGAHTIRLLAEMICTFGILDRKSFKNEKQLDEAIRDLHSTFKSAIRKAWLLKVISVFSHSSQEKLSKKTQQAIGKKINAQRIKLNDLLELPTHENINDCIHSNVKIKVVGVWDTVSAMGMPIDELRNNIFFAGHAFVDNKLHPSVEHGRQALAIDEMRQTFKPELWHQSLITNPDENIEQVWFSGVHSNVGGGYPKDELSLPSLNWMMAEAKLLGLQFIADKEKEFTQMANPNGTMYNSRAGVANIYRFKPRHIETLTQNSMGDESAAPLIDQSVHQRVTDSPAEYSPFNLPGDSLDRMSETRQTEQSQLQDKAWNIVWWQRVLHFTFLTSVIGFVYTGFELSKQIENSGESRTNSSVHFLDHVQTGLTAASEANLFYISKYIFPGYVNNLPILGLFLALIAGLIFYRAHLTAHLNSIGNIFWNKHPFDKNRVNAEKINVGFVHRVIFWLAQKLRKNESLNNGFLPFFKHTFIPIVTTLLFYILVFYIVKYAFIPNLNCNTYLTVSLLATFPVILFFSALKVMVTLSNYQNVSHLMETQLAGKKPLNKMTKAYDAEYVDRLWSVITRDKNARASENKMLRLDLLFPLIYGAGLALPILYCLHQLKPSFATEWFYLPVVIAVLADWLENSLLINQFKTYIGDGKENLSETKIMLASIATRIKILSILTSAVLLAILICVMLSEL